LTFAGSLLHSVNVFHRSHSRNPKRNHRIIINNIKSYTFQAKAEDQFDEWTEAINITIENNKNNGWKMIMPKIKKFWKYKILTYIELKLKSRTGDILLFAGKHIGSRVQRTITRSRFGKL